MWGHIAVVHMPVFHLQVSPFCRYSQNGGPQFIHQRRNLVKNLVRCPPEICPKNVCKRTKRKKERQKTNNKITVQKRGLRR